MTWPDLGAIPADPRHGSRPDEPDDTDRAQMSWHPNDPAAAAAAAAHRRYWGRVLSATLRMARDVDVAEEATADAFLLALQTWPERGVPDSVEAWLLTAARRRAIDRIRRLVRLRQRQPVLATTATSAAADAIVDAPVVDDDELRLVVLCCHPAIDHEAQVALTMRLGCGVPTDSIAAAFLVATPTMAARLTRAKRRIAGSGAGVELPDDVAVEERMPAVRRTVHLAYTMGHTAGSGANLRDDELAGHAQRLARSLHGLRPDDTETTGLLALILLTEARAATRVDAAGGQVLLADADRSRWDRELIDEGLALVAEASGAGAGPLVLQAAIAADHARATSFADTDWDRMVRHYDALLLAEPSATVAIGRSVALSYLLGAAAGLADLDGVLDVADLTGYPYAHAARAQLLERLDRREDAAAAWTAAAAVARTDAERRYFTGRAGHP
jgi:RNA polymerase sigma-70 factor (ECF subfamily)